MTAVPHRAAPTQAALEREAVGTLSLAGVEAPRRDARLLLAAALGRPPAALIGAGGEPVDADEAARFRDLVQRRARREPVSRILGRREFWSLSFEISPDVLDPRADSETLVAAALEAFPARDRPLRVLDLGVGGGCLLLSVLAERPLARGLGLDASPAAAVVARRNALALGLASRAMIAVGDWARAVAGPVDLILANPPYIPHAEIKRLSPEVRDFDPPDALDGGADGLDPYRVILAAAADLLPSDGVAALEVGVGQWRAVADIAEASGLAVLACRRDAAGIARCLVAGGKKRLGKPLGTG